jgi:guanylate kinase
MRSSRKGAILVLSGPSGAGKSTIIQRAEPMIGEFHFSISTTTRLPRGEEKDGIDYYFIDTDTFEKDIRSGYFLEYALVHGNYYGTSIKPVERALKEGKLVIFDIDVQGHALAREKMGDMITSVFITPPDPQELRRRLEGRSTDTEETIKRRLSNAAAEIERIGEYDFMIINDDIDSAVESFAAVARAARLRPGSVHADKFIKRWLSG